MAEKVRDPDCGIEIKPQQAAAKPAYPGKTSGFGSPGCKMAFEPKPATYGASRQSLAT